MLKTVDLGYCSSLSVAWMLRFWFISFQSSTIYKTSLVQGSLFLLAVYTHEVPLCLCSVFCSCSQVWLSTARYRVFGARTTPRTVSRNLNGLAEIKLPSQVHSVMKNQLSTFTNYTCILEMRAAQHAIWIRVLVTCQNSRFHPTAMKTGHQDWAWSLTKDSIFCCNCTCGKNGIVELLRIAYKYVLFQM